MPEDYEKLVTEREHYKALSERLAQQVLEQNETIRGLGVVVGHARAVVHARGREREALEPVLELLQAALAEVPEGA
jgi:hypothetical protein